MKRRILAMLLSVLMILSVFPLTLFTAFAEETETGAETGTETETETTEHSYVNLQNAIHKMETDKEITIGWITDSIGMGSNASFATPWTMEDGIDYSSRVHVTKNPMSYTRVVSDWFQTYAKENYGIDGANVDVFYSTYGGATAQRALGYVREDMLAYCPDVVILELWNGTNVDTDSTEDVYAATQTYLESIVQQIYAVNPYCDIIFFNVGGLAASRGYEAITQKYNIPDVNVIDLIFSHFQNKDIFGSTVQIHNDYTDENGEKARATRGYYFNGGWPHLNEEGYAFYSKKLIAEIEALFLAAKEDGSYKNGLKITQPDDMRIVVDEEGNVTLPANTLYSSTDKLYLTTDRVDADELNYDASWTLTDGEIDVTKPLDSQEKTAVKSIKATADGATITFTLNGSGFLINGSGSYTVSIDGVEKKTYSGETVYIRCAADDAEGTYEITITAANGATVSEIYTYSHNYTPIEIYENVEQRYTVTYYAKLADEHLHTGQKNGYNILPKYLTWLQVQRDEVFGSGSTVTLRDGSVLDYQIEVKGSFVGWVEADSYYYFEGEKFPVIESYTYEDGKIVYEDGTEKTLYLAGDELSVTRDMTLVAVYSGGYDFDAQKYSVIMKDGDKIVKSTQTTGQITMLERSVKEGYRFAGWSDGENIYGAYTVVYVVGDTTFEAVWEPIDMSEGTLKYNLFDEWLGGTTATLVRWDLGDYDGAANTFTGGFYKLSGAEKDGKSALALEMTTTVKTSRWLRDSLTLPGIGVKLGDMKYILMDMYYDVSAADANNEGGYLTLGINTSGGSTFYVYSYETIVKNEWQTYIFDLSDAHVAPDAAYDTSSHADEYVKSISLYWYRYNGSYANINDPATSVYYFSDITFTSVSPFFTASFENENGEALADPVSTKDKVTMPDAVSETGKKFLGWTDGTNVYQPGDVVTITEDTAFTPKWYIYNIYNVTFESDGETLADLSGEQYEEFTLPEAITKENYAFAGWSDGTNTYKAGDAVAIDKDTTFTALWTPLYTVVVNDGTTDLVNGLYGGYFTLPEAPVKEGAIFEGWSDGTSTYEAGEQVLIVGNTSFTAKWVDTIAINYSELLETSAGMVYNGSTAGTYDAETKIDTVTVINANGVRLHLTAQKDVLFDGKNTVQFNNYAGGGTWMNPTLVFPASTGVTLENAKNVTIQYYYSGNSFFAGQTMTIYLKTSSGYVYATSSDTIVHDQWATISFDLSTHANYESYKDLEITEVKLYYYKVESCAATKATQNNGWWNIDFQYNFGDFYYSNGENAIKLEDQGEISYHTQVSRYYTLPDVEAREGYVFDGYSVNGSETLLPAGTEITLSGSDTISMVWRSVKLYDITFAYGDDTVVKKWTAETEYTLPSDTFSKEGFVIKGWKNSLGKYFAAGETVIPTKNETYTAIWALDYSASEGMAITDSYAKVSTAGNSGLMIDAFIAKPDADVAFEEFGIVFIQSSGLSGGKELLLSEIYTVTERKQTLELSANVAKANVYTEQDGKYYFSVLITDFWYQWLIQDDISARPYAKVTVDGVETVYYGETITANYFDKAFEAYNDKTNGLTDEERDPLYVCPQFRRSYRIPLDEA